EFQEHVAGSTAYPASPGKSSVNKKAPWKTRRLSPQQDVKDLRDQIVKVPTLAPPQTYRVCPVTKPFSGSAKNMVARLMSSTRPRRLTGMEAASWASRSLPASTTS